MNRTKFLKGPCQSCGGHLEFPAEAIGTSIDCPHCGRSTELMLAAPPEVPTVPRRTVVWTAITILILLLGLGGALMALKRAEKRAAAKREQEAASPASTETSSQDSTVLLQSDLVTKAGFRASEVTLQKTPGSSLVHAVGTLTSTLARQRFGVKVHLDLFDASGKKVGEATDYQPVLEPNGQWNFKALVVSSKAASAKIGAIKEDQ